MPLVFRPLPNQLLKSEEGDWLTQTGEVWHSHEGYMRAVSSNLLSQPTP